MEPPLLLDFITDSIYQSNTYLNSILVDHERDLLVLRELDLPLEERVHLHYSVGDVVKIQIGSGLAAEWARSVLIQCQIRRGTTCRVGRG